MEQQSPEITKADTTVGHFLCLASAALLLAMLSSSRAEARDLRSLEKLLVPIFVAQNIGNVCAAWDSSFLHDSTGANGSVNDYSERAKYEVAHALESREVTVVLRGAADRARETVREMLRNLRGKGADPSEADIAAFCHGPAKQMFRTTLAAHDSERQSFLRDVEAALRSSSM